MKEETINNVRNVIIDSLRAIHLMSISIKPNAVIKVDGKLSIGIDCEERAFDDAMDSIQNTHWFEKSNYSFLTNKINITFYIL